MHTRPISIGVIAITFVVSLLAMPAAGTQALAATATTFSGQATVLSGRVAGIQLPCIEGPANCGGVVDTGPFDNAQQISESRSLICYDVPTQDCLVTPPNVTGQVLSVEVLHAAVVAGGDTSSAEASVANFSLNVAGQQIGADILEARASATCTNNGAVVRAGAETSVTINGQKYTVGTSQTQTIPLPGVGFVVINEGASGPHSGSSIDASALHIVIPAADTDLTVAKVHADVACAQNLGCPSKHAFVTGGGFINPAGTKLHFAVAGRNQAFWGHVLYKPAGIHVKDPYALVFNSLLDLNAALKTEPNLKFDNSKLRDLSKFEGAAILKWSAADGSLLGEVLVIDMGEPGVDNDYFEIASLGSTTGALGRLAGGNIQMHGKC